MEIINGDFSAFGRIVSDTRASSALAANRNVESFVALFFEVSDSDVFSDFDAAFDFDAKFFHDVDFSIDDIFLEFVGRNAVSKHTAWLFVFLKDGWGVAHFRQIVGGG